jgi:hypothetical protein
VHIFKGPFVPFAKHNVVGFFAVLDLDNGVERPFTAEHRQWVFLAPALGNEFITIIKETSLASTFYVGELMTQYHVIVGKTHNSLPILMIIGIIYFVLNFVLSKLLGVFERRMKAYA